MTKPTRIARCASLGTAMIHQRATQIHMRMTWSASHDCAFKSLQVFADQIRQNANIQSHVGTRNSEYKAYSKVRPRLCRVVPRAVFLRAIVTKSSGTSERAHETP